MIKAFIFIMKYKILKDPINLSYHTKEFFQLSKSTQRKVLDKYFNKLYSTTTIWCSTTLGTLNTARLPSHSKGISAPSGAV